MSADADANLVTLFLPAAVEHVQLARLVAAGVAGRLGWDVDTIEDLRIAVDELCIAAIDAAAAGGDLRLEYRWDRETVRVEGTRPAPARPNPRVSDLSTEILDALADEWHIDGDDTTCRFTLVKRLRDQSA